MLDNSEIAKEHIAEFFENLYQAGEGRPEYTNWMEKIRLRQTIKRLAESTEMNKPTQDITTKEIIEATKKLKRGKAMGPDQIPNEIFTQANTETIEKFREVLNNIAKRKAIPSPWQTGKIVRLYQGKGNKGQCSNERGITLASNVGKVFERIINERVRAKVKMSENQAGGKKNSATADHIFILQTIIKEITDPCPGGVQSHPHPGRHNSTRTRHLQNRPKTVSTTADKITKIIDSICSVQLAHPRLEPP